MILSVTIESTAGDVLAVPIASVSVAADGRSRVQVQDQDRDRTTRFVAVDPGLAAKGLVAVTALDGALDAGDLVVVGGGDHAR